MTRLEATVQLPDGPVEVSADAGALTVVPDRLVLAAIAGIDAPPGRHSVILDGRALGRRSPAARVRAGLVPLLDAPIAPEVTVQDHLAVITSPARARLLLAESPLLAGRGDEPAGWLSGGERRVLAWCRALAAQPRAVLVAPEALAGLDAIATGWTDGVIADWRRSGVAVVTVSASGA